MKVPHHDLRERDAGGTHTVRGRGRRVSLDHLQLAEQRLAVVVTLAKGLRQSRGDRVGGAVDRDEVRRVREVGGEAERTVETAPDPVALSPRRLVEGAEVHQLPTDQLGGVAVDADGAGRVARDLLVVDLLRVVREPVGGNRLQRVEVGEGLHPVGGGQRVALGRGDLGQSP